MKYPDKVPCRHCSKMYTTEEVYTHEFFCICSFRSLGKRFAEKPVLQDNVAPPVRVSSVVYTDGHQYAVLQDKAFELYQRKPRRLERLGSYRKDHVQIQRYRVVPLMVLTDEDCEFYTELWNSIVSARYAGAKL